MNSRSLILLSAVWAPCLVRAGDITIYEDAYGVPSIVAHDLKDATFGIGYVQARDYAERMSLNFKFARGRSGEATGKSALLQDGFLRGLGFEERAKEATPHLSPEIRAIIQSYLAGANKALAEQKGKLPQWVEPFTDVNVLSLAQFVNAAFPLLDLSAKISPGAGSNQFALAPSKTSTKHPILSIDPHLGWDGQDGGIIWHEFAVYTPEIHFRGVAIPGLPTGVMGHNDKVAWSMTNNNPALYTMYTVKTNPDNHNQYSYHGQWRDFKTQSVQLRYLENGELKSNTISTKLTDWGPMIPFSNRTARFAIPDAENSLRQSVAMMKATNAKEFRGAFDLHGISMWNFVYADVGGNIGYQYNAFLPQRDASFDWSKVLAGDDPKTAWGDLWSMNDLPHAENPASGILVNCNSAPFLTTLGNEIKTDWPSYVTSYGPTTRWEILSSLLKQPQKISPNRAMEIATDCTVPYAKETVAQLKRFVSSPIGIDELTRWDKKAKVDSVGCALYTYWLRENKSNPALSALAGKGTPWTAEQGASAGESFVLACAKMLSEQKSVAVPWGKVQYMQRGDLKLPVQGFGYVAPGSGIAAVSPASAGANTLKNGRSHATFGSSFRMVVSLDPKGIQSWSVLPYGNSNVPSSPHYSDQMALYAKGKYKPTSFGVEQAKKAAVKSYHLNN